MELEHLALSVACLIAVAAVLGFVGAVGTRPLYGDELQLAADVWSVYRSGGCGVGAYRLGPVRATRDGLELARLVPWNGAVTARIELPVDADRELYEGCEELTLCWIDGVLVIRSGAARVEGRARSGVGG
ncbi:MAG: hypothetical protein DRJ56_07910, partial [Thermoprotei archaeon]